MVVSGSSCSGPGAGARVLKRDMIAGAVMTDSIDLPLDVEFSAFDATGEHEQILALPEVTESGAMVNGFSIASATAGVSAGSIDLLEVTESAIAKVKGSAAAAACAPTGATVGESQRIIGFRESPNSSLSSSGCLSVLLVFAPFPHLLLCLLLLYMRALHLYTTRVRTRFRIRCWLSGAEKCDKAARSGAGLSCRP